MKLLVVLALFLCGVSGAKILCFFYFSSISHQYVFRQIAKDLSLRGHEVTFVTPNSIQDPELTNLTEINVNESYSVFQRHDLSNLNSMDMNLISVFLTIFRVNEDALITELSNPKVLELLQKEDDFDLVLIEAHCPILYGLKHKFKAPLISVSSLDVFAVFHNIMGNPIHPVLYPSLISPVMKPVSSLLDKMSSLIFLLSEHLMHELYIYPKSDAVAREYFGEDMPYIKDVIRETSMFMVNVNPIFSDRKAMVPNVIEFFNVHMSRKEQMSEVSTLVLNEFEFELLEKLEILTGRAVGVYKLLAYEA